jgi:ArsR family transcriptional regulator, lead/cadmium/zinc/bismuth-responsive transcriptional repressor
VVARIGSLDTCEVRMVDPERVEAVRASMPPDGDIADLADIFGLLGDPGRLRLLTSLLEAGELCVCDLAASTGLNESSVSHALRLLRAHRVVQVRRAGRMSYYRLADSHVRLLLDLGLQHTGHTIALHVEDHREQ